MTDQSIPDLPQNPTGTAAITAERSKRKQIKTVAENPLKNAIILQPMRLNKQQANQQQPS